MVGRRQRQYMDGMLLNRLVMLRYIFPWALSECDRHVFVPVMKSRGAHTA